jgi:hypothetical protein
MVKVAVTDVELSATKLLTVMPPPDTVIAVAPARLTPVSVTDVIVLPLTPEVGLIDVSVGP